jgi:hypothetical protein
MPEDGMYAADKMDACWESCQVERVVGVVSAVTTEAGFALSKHAWDRESPLPPSRGAGPRPNTTDRI